VPCERRPGDHLASFGGNHKPGDPIKDSCFLPLLALCEQPAAVSSWLSCSSEESGRLKEHVVNTTQILRCSIRGGLRAQCSRCFCTAMAHVHSQHKPIGMNCRSCIAGMTRCAPSFDVSSPSSVSFSPSFSQPVSHCLSLARSLSSSHTHAPSSRFMSLCDCVCVSFSLSVCLCTCLYVFCLTVCLLCLSACL